MEQLAQGKAGRSEEQLQPGPVPKRKGAKGKASAGVPVPGAPLSVADSEPRAPYCNSIARVVCACEAAHKGWPLPCRDA